MNDVNKTLRMNRLKLVLVAGVFLLPMAVAGLLGVLDWSPGTRSHGEPIRPQRSFSDIHVVMDAGGNWQWRDREKPRLTLVALSHGDCDKTCVGTLTLLRNARITLGKNQDRLRLLHLGPAPGGKAGRVLGESWHHGRVTGAALEAFMPTRAGAVSALLVESNGTALVHYPVGFDPEGLKKDLHKVVR